MGWEGYKSDLNEMMKINCVDKNPTPQECVAEDESGNYGMASTRKNVGFRIMVKVLTEEYGVTVNGEISEVSARGSRNYLMAEILGIKQREETE